jgi:hypothetical protein
MTEVKYDIWIEKAPQNGTNKLVLAQDDNMIGVGELATLFTFMQEDAKIFIGSSMALLGYPAYSDLNNNNLVAINTPKVALTSILGLYHQWDKGRNPFATTVTTGTGSSGNFKFQIKANGDVEIRGLKGTDDNALLAISKSQITVDAEDYTLCKKHSIINSEACTKQLAFIAGVGGEGVRENMSRGILRNLDLGSGADPNDKSEANKVANAYAILKRLKWRAHADSNGVYTFEQFVQDDRKLPETVALLRPMFVAAADVTVDQVTFDALVSTNLTNLGILTKECIEIINQNKDIFKAQMDRQRFSTNPTRTIVGRMNSISPTPLSYKMWGGNDGTGVSVMLGSHVQSGGGNTHDAKARELDKYVAQLGASGKRLAPATYSKFKAKIAELKHAEEVVEKFILDLSKFNGNKGYADGTNPVIAEADIKEFNDKTQAVTKTALVLQAGMFSIKAKLDHLHPNIAAALTGTASAPKSYIM